MKVLAGFSPERRVNWRLGVVSAQSLVCFGHIKIGHRRAASRGQRWQGRLDPQQKMVSFVTVEYVFINGAYTFHPNV